jgi:hypothetical protein
VQALAVVESRLQLAWQQQQRRQLMKNELGARAPPAPGVSQTLCGVCAANAPGNVVGVYRL